MTLSRDLPCSRSLAQGRSDEALVSIQTALAITRPDSLARTWLRAAEIEIALAAGKMAIAQSACDELRETVAHFPTALLEATTGALHGEILLAAGAAPDALAMLRSACLRWQQLAVPYETARVRVSLARAYEVLGDTRAAELELAAALQVFRSLGAALDIRRLETRQRSTVPPHGLSPREVEVLALISAGLSNRGIAGRLSISEKTVARHLTNIFTKIGVASRTEAARFAFEHQLTGMGKSS